MANTLVSLQILPKTPNGENLIPYVDQAIAIIAQSGVPYRVGPLETTMEGELHQLLSIVGQVNEAMVEAGCPHVLSQVKVYYCPTGASMGELTEKYE